MYTFINIWLYYTYFCKKISVLNNLQKLSFFYSYGGYCPHLKYRVGKTYGQDTHELSAVSRLNYFPVHIYFVESTAQSVGDILQSYSSKL